MTFSTQEFRGEVRSEPAKTQSSGPLSRLGSKLLSLDLRGAIVPVGALVLLELFVRMGWVSPYVLPPPSDLYTTFLYLAEGPLWTNIGASALRVLIGFTFGSLLAIAIGSIVGLWYSAERYLEPSFQALRAVPSLAWVPLLMIWFGIGETSKIVLIAKSAFFPVYLSLFAMSTESWSRSAKCIVSPCRFWSGVSLFRHRYRICSPACVTACRWHG